MGCAEADENVVRLDFAPSEKVAIGRALQEREQDLAKARQRAGGGIPGSGKLPPPEKAKTRDKVAAPSGNFPEGAKGETSVKVAARVGMSRMTWEKAKAVVEAARHALRRDTLPE